MHNFGLTRLVLVAPVADPLARESLRLSTQGEFILRAARVVADLGEAVADCGVVVGTSARTAGLVRGRTAGPPEAGLPFVTAALPRQPTALVFGPEPTGLSNVELSRCHHLLSIPANPAYPALNLAQAVAVCLHELHRCWLARTEPPPATESAASFAEQERAFAHLRRALEAVHFLYGPKSDALMHAVRHLIGRARPTPMEVKLLHGLARQLLWVAGQRAAPDSSREEGHEGDG
jgi:tRNA/rRNA methyltransferase